ncbi:prephenate dehydrogenase [Clostridiales Family XIII bacterium PM5-7]
MNIGIVGLGLIGGSMAKAYKQSGATVLGCDKNSVITDFAKMAGAIDDELDETHFSSCDMIFIAVTPKGAIQWLKENAPRLTKDTIVIDCCGTKRQVCETGFQLAETYGITYFGGHPMAGKERGGFKNSSADLFAGEPFILVPNGNAGDVKLMCKVQKLIKAGGFGRISIATPEEHDQVIAFTSQMPHIVSNGFIKSKTALENKNMISAGSYKDFTRVAYLDERMWAELFMENKDNLNQELDALIEELLKYQKALDEDDMEELVRLLAEGREKKSEVDKRCS